MRRLVFAGLLVLLACSLASGQQILKQWEFNKDGDTEGWWPTHSLSALEVKNGSLKGAATDGDPYMHASRENAFDIQGNSFQYIEVRMKNDTGKSAEFFWANSTAGKDAGFVAGKERSFACLPDNEWHVYYLYPLWDGQVTRLRMDPPEDATFEIDYIRIMQGPITQHDPKSGDWDFTRDVAGWVCSSGGTPLLSGDGGAQTQFLAERAQLVSSALDLKAADFKYLYLQLTTDAPLTGHFTWSETEEATFPARNSVELKIPAGTQSVNLDPQECQYYSGDLKRLSLELSGPVGTKVTLRRMTLSDRPLGPAQLQLLSLTTQEALPSRGQRSRLVATLRNSGGEVLTGATVKVAGPAGAVSIGGATRAVRSLKPFETAEVTWEYTPLTEGRISFTLNDGRADVGTAEAMAAPPAAAVKPTQKPDAQVSASSAWIGNSKVMLVWAKGKSGYLSGRLYALGTGEPKLMAVVPELMSVAVAGDNKLLELPAQEAKTEVGEGKATLRLTGAAQIAGAQVRSEVILSVSGEYPWIDATYSLATDKDLSLSALRGPWMWVGEGSFGDKQDLALFPGVEYMEAGEKSSSTLDIAAPKNLRFAPHPNTITVPSMAIQKDGAIAGLMWNPLQKWDGEHQKPTAVFASPNFIEGHGNHLLGLCLPSIPDWMKANELLAATPYELKAGKGLTLTASLYALAKGEVLQSMDLYFQRFGLPDLPPKARSYEDTLTMSLKAYEDILWSEEAKGWMPVIGWAPGRSMDVALNGYVIAARRLTDRPWADKLTEKGLSLADKSDLGFALHQFGNPAAAMSSALTRARSSALGAPEDGKYSFHPSEKTAVLGVEGATESGICACDVRGLLTDALRTGDQQALDAGLRTLKFMRRFKIPRASQVWEVPVHTPDILASADACEVYLLGYRLTGDKSYLDDAIYWARTGLPFVYMWQAPEQRPLMLGGSIPVFGATFYTGSWFARPVQWNGLEWARVLLELDRWDKSMPWKHFAEMVTISGMNQQSTREKDYGTYTDNWEVISDVECVGCMLAPGRIMTNALDLLGAPVGVDTEVVRDGGKRISINSAPRVSDAKLDRGVLSFGLRYDAGHTAYTTVMAIAEPTQIEVDGVELAKRPGAIDTPEGWSYRADIGCVTLKLQYGQAVRTVRITRATVMEPGFGETSWDFNEGVQGWIGMNDVEGLEVRDGNLIVKATGGDPYIGSPALLADASKYSGVTFRAKATLPGGQVFFAAKGGFSATRSKSFNLPADGQFHEVTVDLSDNPEWTGMITQLRLDCAAAPCELQIDWIRLVKRAAKPTQ
jgi:hypothetical protein